MGYLSCIISKETWNQKHLKSSYGRMHICRKLSILKKMSKTIQKSKIQIPGEICNKEKNCSKTCLNMFINVLTSFVFILDRRISFFFQCMGLFKIHLCRFWDHFWTLIDLYLEHNKEELEPQTL